ncbi:AraC family transcriptional regulator [Terrabacter tumescens]|uniref:AraC family transcriptional regulator n=1 Tax=Terrabacter tumescens TaxID=60443 RepID=A0ABQ2HQU6_9MICO|nr:AraC family transcriptional regulator [Terrabacter tumescens]GGM87323.1 AraC family transcriptional regulator [Terrabacter tumescens]
MDTLSSVLDGHRARGASLLRCEMQAPWALRIQDEAVLGLVVLVRGSACLAPEQGDAVVLGEGDLALVRGLRPYVFGDDPSTAPMAVVEPGNVCRSLTGEALATTYGLGTRTWGNAGEPRPAGADGQPDGQRTTTFLTASWELPGQLTGRLVDALPDVAVVPAEQLDPALVDLLAREVQRDLPGQEVVLDRLVDLVLVGAVRAWFDRDRAAAPAWWAASTDPVVGRALGLLHGNPAHPWTLERLAAAVHVSRATLSRRFADLVGRPPMAYLAQWRLARAADLLRDGTATVEQVAHAVGYANAFAFSAAFKREHGLSPRAFRAASTAGGATRPVRPSRQGAGAASPSGH